jgi:HpcH/HpaI aldolase/citrate lyase family
MPADVVFRVGRAYGMTADRGVYQAVAVKDGRITAAERSRDDLDSLIGPGTVVIDDPELVLYPAFADTHNHQLLAARDLDYVSLEQARSIDELVQALRDAAARTPAGEWIMSSRCWHETHLREGRLLPPVTEAQQADLLARQCRLYNRRGIGVVRDPGLMPNEVPVYQAVADRGELTTRSRLMFWVMPQATVADTLAYVDSLPAPGSLSSDGLGIWVLDTGVDGVIVPAVESAGQARQLVQAACFPPGGRRSKGLARVSLLGRRDQPLLLPMVETRAGFDALDDILGVDGVDGTFIGPYDLSLSLGCTSTLDDAVVSAITSVIDRTRGRGRITGIFTGNRELTALLPAVDLLGVDTDAAALRAGLKGLFG